MKSQGKTIIKKNNEKTLAENAGIQVTVAILGFLFANTSLIGGMYPFGVAVVASCPISAMITSSAGAMAGCFFVGNYLMGAKYIASIALINIVRYLIFRMKMKNTPVISMVLSGASLLLGFLVIALMIPLSLSEIFLSVAEILIASGTSYFLFATLEIFSKKDTFKNLSSNDLTGLTVVFAIVIMSLARYNFFSISPASIISAIAILLFASYGRDFSAVVLGIATGFALSLTSSDFLVVALGFAIGSLVASIFAKIGIISSAISFIIINVICSLIYGFDERSIITIYEVVIAGCIFLAIPKSGGRYVVSLFESSIKPTSNDSFKRGVLMRLDFAGAALSDVSDSVEAVAHKLRRNSNPVIDDVFRNVKQDICDSCSRYKHCYIEKENKEKRQKDFNLLMMTLKEYGKIELSHLPSSFADECENVDKFLESACDYYTKIIMKKTANDRVDEFRSVVVDHFKNLSDMLFEMSDSISKSDLSDRLSEEKIYQTLKESGYEILDVSANVGESNRMSVEIRIKTGRKPIKEGFILQSVSASTGRNFDSFSKTQVGDDILISLCEKVEIFCDFAVTQHNCNNCDLCGDSYGYFHDGRGHAVMILSDGMGSGGRAAVDGAMAAGLMSRLIRAGIGVESAIKIVNSAMLYKSSDESLATLDILILNLYDGTACIYKCGGAKSIIIGKKEITDIKADSMPIGILKDVFFEKIDLKLFDNDIILMLSDGVTDIPGDWLYDEIYSFEGDDLQDFTDIIATKAKLRRKMYDDDITVMALRINRDKK
jgi:stage II sporulation protein E